MDVTQMKTADMQSESDRNEASRIVKYWERMDNESVNWKSHWQECYENIVPRKEDVIATRLPGDRRNSDIYDSTAVLANERLAGALHGMLTNPETKFFEITFGDPRLDSDDAVKGWCQEVGDRMFRVLNNTNFQTEIYEIYIDLGAIGTACLYMGEHEENIVHFSARAMKEIRIDENSLGLIDVIYRLFHWTGSQIIQEFGEENVSEDVKRSMEKGSSDKFYVLHAVEPVGRSGKRNERDHAYKSTYLLKDTKFILSKGGFREFPYAVPRWSKTTGEKYGRGPGMAMLPDILMLNAMMLTVIQGAQKTVDPPLEVEDDGVIGQVRLEPGGLTIKRAGSAPITPLITNARIDFGQQMLEDVRSRIRSGFYVDQLSLPRGPQMTAEEVIHRRDEMLKLMGPVLGRQHFELLKPMITRLFDIMHRKGLIPTAPVSIQGKNFDVRYSSLIARAQRMEEGANIGKAMSMIAPLAQIKPDIVDVVDSDKVARKIWDVYGASHSLLLTQSELDKKRKAQAAAAAQANQQQQEQHQAEVLGKAAPVIGALTKGKGNAPQA